MFSQIDHWKFHSTALIVCFSASYFASTWQDRAFAIQTDDNSASRELVALVRKNEKDSFRRGEELFRTTADSRLRPVACRALALLEIQAGRYPEAWKALTSKSSMADTGSLLACHDRFLLWLLLEAHSHEQAELQFRKLVTFTASAGNGSIDGADTAGFLGGVIALLEHRGESSCVSAGMLSKGRTALEGLSNKVALHRYNSSYENVRAWANSLQACAESLRTLDVDQRSAQAAAIALQLADAKEKLSKQMTELRELRKDKRKFEQFDKQARHNWNPNLGMPPVPRQPSNDPGDSEKDDDRKEADYKYAVQAYPQKLAAWKIVQKARQDIFERELRLNSQRMAETDVDIATTQDNVKKFEELVQSLSDQAMFIQHVRALLESNGGKNMSLFKPSCFNLLDFNQEATRLEFCLRDLK